MSAALLLLAFADAASAQPIEIQADQFEMLLEERMTTYTGNVVATQGSRAITGRELVVRFNEDNEILAMRASGEPARLTDAEEEAPISLAGALLDYDFDESVVRAEGGGVLSRGGDTIAARRIVYDLKAENARAVGDDTHRVTLTLAPAADRSKLLPNP
ncbi:MAG: lipopolysaccharide transport periplasmic protein LptA [Gammaproteobacteria bacterium]|nr:lipopolysaccharide transport periplasmic protein LptA [Gammaproteobacteria bacterium]MDE0364759.1 lipopolysaccharide transport periplasmic protein LptA [Gammaproteobacteria bacterium]